ncbi:hypothetical protein V5O48_006732 [Marasmius crinis-equi]|uniref:F-box domain-containing protein n=1 Tax=Marasmius crinis-equi TaxID=585013 RepID=A0ABR3FIP9_9AGAR
MSDREYTPHSSHINLPSEILAHVFSLCLPKEPLANRHLLGSASRRDWLRRFINFTHVCSRWRAVALHAPCIWCRPDFAFPGLAAEMFRRSRSTPLHLTIDPNETAFEEPRIMELLNDMLNDLSRLGGLELTAYSVEDGENSEKWTQWETNILDKIGQWAPCLSSLILHGPHTAPPPTLSLNGDYPRLRELRSWDFGVGQLNLASMRGLEVLDVTFPGPPRTVQFLRQLDSVQSSLQELNLRHCCFPPPSGWETPRRVLFFPQLRRLRLSSTFRSLASFLPSLTFPATTAVEIMTSDISDSDFHVLVTFVAQCFPRFGSNVRKLESIEVRSNIFSASGVLLKTWATCDTLSRNRLFSLQLYDGQDNDQSPRIDKILSVLPLMDLKRLSYQFSPDDSVSLVEHFQALPSLRTVHEYHGTFFDETVQALSQVRAPGQLSVETPSTLKSLIAFPALSRIELIGFAFGIGGEASQDWPPDLWPNRFAEALKGRSDRGASIPAVILQDCKGVKDEHVQELRRMNVKVDIKETYARLDLFDCAPDCIYDLVCLMDSETKSIKPASPENPTERVPNEILVHVFSLCIPHIDKFLLIRNVERRRERVQQWVNFTHVCRRWRTVAVHTPSLWTRPDFAIPDLCREMLARSRSALLDLITEYPLQLGSTDFTELLIDALRDFSRVRSLRMRIHELDPVHHAWSEKLMSSLRNAAPSLSFLDIEHVRGVADRGLPLLPQINPESHPRLTDIRITDCGLQWPSGFTSSLKRISVTYTSLNAVPSMDSALTTEFLDALTTAPNVEVLEIANYSPSHSTPRLLTPIEYTPLYLPNLRHLFILSIAPEVVNLLPLITFPPATTIHLSLSITHETAFSTHGPIPDLLDFITKFFRSVPSQRRIRAIEIRDWDTVNTMVDTLSIKTWSTSHVATPTVWPPTPDNPQFRLDLNCAYHSTQNSALQDTASEILSALPLEHLETLYSEFIVLPPNPLMQHFKGLSSLRTIIDKYGHLFTETTLPLLGGAQEKVDSPDGHPKPAFPGLTSLVLDNFRFGDLAFKGVRLRENWVQFFWGYLKARLDRGGKIPFLVFKGCSEVKEEQIQMLQNKGVEVISVMV